MSIILAKCQERGVDDYTRFCTVLTADSESDFKVNAQQMMQDKDANGNPYFTEGVFQQTSKYYTGDLYDVAHTCDMFLDRFAGVHRTQDAVTDCWYVQQWSIVDKDGVYQSKWTPADHPAEFKASPETLNYTNRLSKIEGFITTGIV